jgi:hypothetical protein
MKAAPEMHPIIAQWFDDPHLHVFKDSFGRSARRHGFSAEGQTSDSPGFLTKLGLLADLRNSNPEFFSEHDYRWAFERESYINENQRDPGIADQSLRFQLTTLRNLVGVWNIVRKMPEVHLKLSDICARYVMSPDLSPSCRSAKGFGYLMIPFGFRRISFELLLACRKLRSPDISQGADQFAALLRPISAGELERFPLPFIARRLSMQASGDVAFQHGKETLLFDTVPPFVASRIDVAESARGTLESGLHDLLMEWSANHELGHLIYSHSGRRRPEDEKIADTTSTDVSLLGWGWWAKSGEVTGLPEPVWCLLGPILFFWTVEIILRLDILVLDYGPDTIAGLDRQLVRRKQQVSVRLQNLISKVWPAFGVVAPRETIEAVNTFQRTLASISLSFAPRPDLAEAVKRGREAIGPSLGMARG